MMNREPRRKVSISARARAESGWCDVLIQNMSTRGLMGRARQPYPSGTVVEIRRADHVIVGRVVWSDGGSFGIRTADPIDIDRMIGADRSARRSGKDPAAERRGRRRAATAVSVAAQADRSRALARAFQFFTLGLACAAGAGTVGYMVWSACAAPVRQIETALAGR